MTTLTSSMKNFKAVFTLLLAIVTVVGLSACAEGDGGAGEGADTAMTADTMGMQNDSMQGGMMSDSVTVQSTISMLQRGVTSIPVNAAVQNINGWQSQLQGMSDLSDLNDNLGELKDELQSDNLDGEDIGEALKELGRLTNQAAQSASGQQGSQIQALGQALTQGGNRLTSGASGQDAM